MVKQFTQVPRCDSCRWWVGRPDDWGLGLGTCHFNAPMPFEIDERAAKRGERTVRACWPGTCADDWCSEFEPHPRPP